MAEAFLFPNKSDLHRGSELKQEPDLFLHFKGQGGTSTSEAAETIRKKNPN